MRDDGALPGSSGTAAFLMPCVRYTQRGRPDSHSAGGGPSVVE